MEELFFALLWLIGLPLGGYAFFIMPIISFITWRRGLRLDREVQALRQELAVLKRDGLVAKVAGEPTPVTETPVAAPAMPEPVIVEPVIPEPEAAEVADAAFVEAAAEPQPIPQPTAETKDFEGRLGGRIYGWLGGVALAFAGIFLVKYSIEQGWLSPGVRVSLGILFGFVLLGVAQWMRTRSNNLGQALTAASMAVLYAALFAGTALYDLLPPAFAFILLAALTFAAIALALRDGPFVGLVGLAGGFLTPLFVSSGEPNLPVLFGFLYLLQWGALVLLKQRGWWYQAAIANGGGLLWAAFVLSIIAVDHEMAGSYAIPLFLIATSWTSIWALESRGGALRSEEMLWTTRGTSIACFGLMALLLNATDYAVMNWFFALLLMGSHLTAARRWTAEDVPAFIGAAIMIIAYALWPATSWDYLNLVAIDRSFELIIVGLVFGGALLFGGWYFAHGAKYPTHWAALSTLGSGFVFGGAYLQLRHQEFLISWPILAVGLAAIHMVLAQRLDALRRQDAQYVGAFALHCLAVSGFIAIAIPMQLEKSWIAIAWSFELPLIAWVANRLDLNWLRRAIWVGAALVLGGIWYSGFPAGETLIFNWLLYGLGIPLMGFVATAYLLTETSEQKLRRVLQVVAAALGFGLLGLEIDHC